ncbi:MAG: hypothetical protein QOG30_2748 [Acidimicrobiaceae bacterium]
MPRTECTTDIDDDDGPRRASSDQGGFVLPWMALMLLVLIAMAGFGVDVWNWWYSAQKVQRSADAGALAGVPLMPDLAAARAKTLSVVQQNGYPSATSTQGAKTNQLVVTVNTQVSNYFTSLLGVSTTNITRAATAEFNAPVTMGAPKGTGHTGNDPENGAVDKHWLNIGAPGVDKHTGDRFADYTNCSGGSYGCTGSINDEYLDSTYVYTVDVVTVPADIQVYDPEFAVGNQNCDNQWLTQAQRDALKALPGGVYTDADTRFATGANSYCTGDDNTNLNQGQATVWIVRDSATSTIQGLQNVPAGPGSSMGGVGPSGAICAHQFDAFVPDSDHYWFDKLNSTAGNASYDADFAKSFHRWYTMCHVTTAGRYFIQVRSNVPYNFAQRETQSHLETPGHSNTSLSGQNRYSLRVVTPNTTAYSPNSSVYSVARLPVYTNTPAGFNPTFYLARLIPGGGSTGRILNLEFYDIGDVSGTTSLTIKPPADASPANSISCSQWVFNGNNANAPPSGTTFSADGCTLFGITGSDYPSGYNGVLVDVKVKVGPTYTCSVNVDTGCWFKIFMSYSSGAQANDTTTWAASIGGDPVRLVK